MAVFREYGFEGTSAGMLVEAMGIGRQSLYNTFGDKWQLYQMALRRYAADETGEHIAMLQSKPQCPGCLLGGRLDLRVRPQPPRTGGNPRHG